MSIGVENKDSSYWVIVPNPAGGPAASKVPPQEHLTPNLVSFEVTEEMGKMKQGNLSLHDASGLFSTFLKSGVPFMIYWGYSRLPMLDIIAGAALNPDGANGSMSRALKCISLSPSGAGGTYGVVTYNASFYAWEYTKPRVEEVWSSITKEMMVQTVLFTDLDVLPVNVFMDWTNGKTLIPTNRPIRQTGKPFTWLQELAAKENCFFDMGHNSAGLPIALWVDKGKIDNVATSAYTKASANSIVGAKAWFSYNRNSGPGYNDVASFSWSQNVGENGSGDNVQISINSATGKPMFIHSVSGSQVITAYSLNTEAITKYEKDIKAKGGTAALVADVARLTSADFNTYLEKGFLIAKKFTTAPEGFGFRIQLELPVGNPALVPGMIARFVGGFPGAFTGTWNTYYVNKVVHKFTGGRYTQSVEVADCFTITGGSLLPAFKGVS